LDVTAFVNNCMVWIRTNQALFLTVLVVVLIALVPLYGILFAPLPDLPEHLLVSKLLWEKLSGVSHLDIEVSRFLGYRLFPAFMMIVFPLCKLCGISFVYLPKIVATTLISIHATVVGAILCSGLKTKSWGSYILAICFSAPAAVCMYSACWFIGFVNYTLAITLLIPAIFLTERFLRSGRLIDASFLFLSLLMVYVAHPFAVAAFWVLWCCSRALAAIATGTVFRELKRLICLGVLFLPIVLYHFWATRGTALEASNHYALGPPFISTHDWYQFRLLPLLDGTFLQADYHYESNSKFFGRAAIGLILFSTALAFRSTLDVRKAALSSVFLIFVSSWISEKGIPVPPGAWLAYDYRFGSTNYAICLALAGMVFIHLIPAAMDKLPYRIILVLLALFSIFASVDHLIKVRQAYLRFDLPARRYMTKVFNHEQLTGVYLPPSRYHPDGTYLKSYICLTQPDCNFPGTTFFTGYVADLYPVKVKSTKPAQSEPVVAPPPLVGYWKLDEANRDDACIDSSGNGHTGTPHGTAVADGKTNKGRSFNGSSDYIDIPTISLSEAITVAAWVYSDNFVQNGFVVAKHPASTQWALFFESDGFLKWRGAGIEKNIVCPAPSQNKWHHIVGKQEGNAASLYVDGVLCSAASLYVDGVLCASGPLPVIGNAPNALSIGRPEATGFGYFTGRIYQVRIYNRALSEAEIPPLLVEYPPNRN
jgi:concanavalin A-like lectin/glucanase superfamily protein